MKIKDTVKSNKYILLGFIIPLLVMIFVFYIMQIAPFGGYSLLISDANAQYIDEITGLRRIILEGKSYFYTWSQIQGSTPFAFAYLSPFNILTLLFPENQILSVITWIVILKIASSGASFAYYLYKVFKRNDLSVSIFAWCYALMAYNIANHYHFIWLDQLIWLPLILWGVERILKEDKAYFFLALMLGISFVTNFYLSYMTGIFAFLYFVCRYINCTQRVSFKPFLMKFLNFMKAPFIAFGCVAVYLVPILLMMPERDGLFVSGNMVLIMRYEFTDLFSKLFIGSFDSFLPNGIPFLYCGLISIILVGFYFISYAITYKEKVTFFTLLVFMLISLTVNPLYVMWHGFKPPIYFEGRFSYLVSFLLVFLAYRGYLHIQTISHQQIHLVFGILVGVIILFNRSSYTYIKDDSLLYTLAFIALYYIILMLFSKGHYDRKQIVLLLALIVGIELSANTMLTIKYIDEIAVYPFASDYYDAFEQIDTVTKSILEEDSDMYRIEFVDKRSMNDGFGVGFPSISHFDSIYNYKVKEAIDKLGVATGHNWIQYKGTTPIVDMLLNIKYVVCEEEEYFGYYYKRSEEYSRIFENPYTISLGFMIQDDLNQLESEKNPINWQQILMNKILGGQSEEYYAALKPNQFVQENVGMKEEEKIKQENEEEHYVLKHYYVQDEQQPSKLIYELVATHKGPCYLYIDSDRYYYINVIVNDQSLYLTQSDMGDVYYLGDFDQGEIIRVELQLGESYLDIKDVYFYQFKQEDFKIAVKRLQESALRITRHTDTEIEGMINVDEKRSIMYLSIPYDEGWQLEVDGEKHKIMSVYEGFLGAELRPGEHQIKLKYVPKGFKIGSMITICTLIIMFFLIKKNRKYKYNKNLK